MWRILFLSVTLVPLLGCGSKRNQGGVVTGTITYKQQPVNGAILHLNPTPGPGPEILIPVTQEGTFNGSEIPPGDYKIVVEPSQPPPQNFGMPLPKDPEMREKFLQSQKQEAPTIAFPNKYKDMLSTDLQVTIQEGEQTLPLELKDGR